MKILVIASHSGGHITPAIAFCQSLKGRDPNIEVVFVTTDNKVEKYLLQDNFNPIYFKKERISPFRFYILIKLYRRAKELLQSLRPNLVVGFGGYLSVPFILASRTLRVPNFIHEQNARIGTANYFLLPFCDKIVCGFPDVNISRNYKAKTLFFENPVRQQVKKIEKEQAKRYFNLDPGKFTVLILGGSQGSHNINKECVRVFENQSFGDMQVIHITGFSDFSWVKDRYDKINLTSRVFDLSDKVEYAYGACDLIICRAGASTLAEIAYLKIPSIIIPYPYAKAHQMNNARLLFDRKACILLEESCLSSEKLGGVIRDILDNPQKLDELRKNIPDNRQVESRCRLADFALKLASRN